MLLSVSAPYAQSSAAFFSLVANCCIVSPAAGLMPWKTWRASALFTFGTKYFFQRRHRTSYWRRSPVSVRKMSCTSASAECNRRARRRCVIVCWRCTASTAAVSSKCSMIRPFPSANNSNPLSQRVHLGPNVDGSPNCSNFGTLLCPSISAKVSDCVPALTKCLFTLVATVGWPDITNWIHRLNLVIRFTLLVTFKLRLHSRSLYSFPRSYSTNRIHDTRVTIFSDIEVTPWNIHKNMSNFAGS